MHLSGKNWGERKSSVHSSRSQSQGTRLMGGPIAAPRLQPWTCGGPPPRPGLRIFGPLLSRWQGYSHSGPPWEGSALGLSLPPPAPFILSRPVSRHSRASWSEKISGCPESEPSIHPHSQAGPPALGPRHLLVAIRESVCVAPGSSLSVLVLLNQIQVQVPKVLLAQCPLA